MKTTGITRADVMPHMLKIARVIVSKRLLALELARKG